MSRGDEKLLTRFQRYGSPEDVAQALIHAQNRISSGELKPSLGADATPEQLAEWRKANGIPEAADKYDLGNLQLNDAGKAMLAKYLPAAHAANMTPDQVRASMTFISELSRSQSEERRQKDQAAESSSQDTLRGEWGPDYKRNMGVIHGMLDGLLKPDEKNAFLGGRAADGTPLGSSPAMMRLLLNLALIDNPAATLVGNAGGDPMKGVNEEIAEIEKLMRTDRRAYTKDEAKQARYRELLDVRERLGKRAA